MTLYACKSWATFTNKPDPWVTTTIYQLTEISVSRVLNHGLKEVQTFTVEKNFSRSGDVAFFQVQSREALLKMDKDEENKFSSHIFLNTFKEVSFYYSSLFPTSYYVPSI